MSEEQILDEHPDLERVDFQDVYRFAADAGRRANPCSPTQTAKTVPVDTGGYHRSW
jgi:hypothetical protein